jgi:hypothetical protein
MSRVCALLLSRRVASQPSTTGISRSIRMMSGCSVAAISHPFWPSSAAIPTRPVEVFDQASPDWVAAHSKDDRDSRGGLLCRNGRRIAADTYEHRHPAAPRDRPLALAVDRTDRVPSEIRFQHFGLRQNQPRPSLVGRLRPDALNPLAILRSSIRSLASPAAVRAPRAATQPPYRRAA